MKSRKRREPWFTPAKPLSYGRRVFLTIISFLTPLILWCLVSYTPFIWHPDMKLDIGGTFGATVYTFEDHVGKDYLPELQAEVEEANSKLTESLQAGEKIRGSKRSNIKILRRLAPLLERRGLLATESVEDDNAIYMTWGELATDPAKLEKAKLTAENEEVVKQNWATLGALSPTYQKDKFPSTPLLQLLPQGKPANPVFLPAPHEVLRTGIHDWSAEVEGKPTMMQRYGDSIGTVLLGFLIAAAIALPLGYIGGTYDFFARLIEPFWDFFRYMPAPAFGTLLVAVCGAHQAPKIALVLIGTFPHLLLMLTKTIRTVEPSLLEAAQTLGAKNGSLLSRVVVPSSMPNVYNDLRIALGWAWTWLVIAELIGVKEGLTEVIDTQGVRRNFDRVYPVIILIGITGFVTDQALAYLKTKLFPWQSND